MHMTPSSMVWLTEMFLIVFSSDKSYKLNKALATQSKLV